MVLNDHTPGFPSAARFVVQAFLGANLDNRSLPGVYIGVVMGRHAGFLTAASALGKKFPDDGPHMIYVPERTFRIESFLADVKRTVDQFGRCVVAVSEGIHDETGTPIITRFAKQIERDAHGNVQLSGTGALAGLLCDQVKDKLGINRVRGDTFGYLQRSFIGCVSDVDQREAREVGEKAVQYAMWGEASGSVMIERTGYYSVDYRLVPLEAVAGKTRTMPDEFISAERHGHDRCVPALSAPADGQVHAGRLPAAAEQGGEDIERLAICVGWGTRGGAGMAAGAGSRVPGFFMDLAPGMQPKAGPQGGGAWFSFHDVRCVMVAVAHTLGKSASDFNVPPSILKCGAGRGKLGMICKRLPILPTPLTSVQKLIQEDDDELLRVGLQSHTQRASRLVSSMTRAA